MAAALVGCGLLGGCGVSLGRGLGKPGPVVLEAELNANCSRLTNTVEQSRARVKALEVERKNELEKPAPTLFAIWTRHFGRGPEETPTKSKLDEERTRLAMLEKAHRDRRCS